MSQNSDWNSAAAPPGAPGARPPVESVLLAKFDYAHDLYASFADVMDIDTLQALIRHAEYLYDVWVPEQTKPSAPDNSRSLTARELFAEYRAAVQDEMHEEYAEARKLYDYQSDMQRTRRMHLLDGERDRQAAYRLIVFARGLLEASGVFSLYLPKRSYMGELLDELREEAPAAPGPAAGEKEALQE